MRFLIFVAFMIPVTAIASAQKLLPSTASQAVLFGPIADSVDGTRETALTITPSEVIVCQDSASCAAKNEATNCTHVSNGVYSCPLDATDTAALDSVCLINAEANTLPLMQCYGIEGAVFASVRNDTEPFADADDFEAGVVAGNTTFGTATETNVNANETKIDAVQGTADTIAGDVQTVLDKQLAYTQLLSRSDAGIATDRAAALGEINNDEGSGSGAFDNTTDSVEAADADRVTAQADLDLKVDGLLKCEVNTAFFAATASQFACILTDADDAAVTTGIATDDLTGRVIEFTSGNQNFERRFVNGDDGSGNSTVWDATNLELRVYLGRALPSAPADADGAVLP
jgi:hypothetical protein